MSKTDARVVSGASQKLMATDQAAALDGLGVKTDLSDMQASESSIQQIQQSIYCRELPERYSSESKNNASVPKITETKSQRKAACN